MSRSHMMHQATIYIISTLLYSLTIEQFLMQPYPGCTRSSILMHPLLISIAFSAGVGAICDAPNSGRGAIFDASKIRNGAIFVAPKIRRGAIFDAPKIKRGAISDANHLDIMSKFKCNRRIFSFSSSIHRVMHDWILFLSES